MFVIEAAEAMRDESQNALLKTLEEPPAFAHLILLSAEPEALLETINSRCQAVVFAALPAVAIARALASTAEPEQMAAAAPGSPPATSSGPATCSRRRAPRSASEAESCAGAALSGAVGSAPWSALLASAEAAGEEVEAATREALEEERELGARRSAQGGSRGGQAGGAPAPHRGARPWPGAMRRLAA